MGLNTRAAFTTLVGVVQARAADLPEQRALTFLTSGEIGTDEETFTYGELDRRARAIAARLQALAAVGTRALLLYPPGLDYVAGFLGCLYAGVVAVPAYPPDPSRLQRTLPRLQSIAIDAQADVVLTTGPLMAMAELLFAQAPDLAALRWMASDQHVAGAEEAWTQPELGGETLAFLQYTSGSTGTPKGVMLTHANLLHNEALIEKAFAHDERSSVVGWLPLYHDMGLIGNLIQPLYVGIPCVLMSPLSFLQRPLRWLRAISHYRATTSGGPNFAYDLCARKVTAAERAELDLSSWRVAFNGAEPIRDETLDRFTQTFAPCGFRRAAFYPCYGLAEATLIVSGGRVDEEPVTLACDAEALASGRAEPASDDDAEASLVVASGHSLGDQRVRIADPETRRCVEEGRVGEIWVAGGSVARGYWQSAEATADTFAAHLSGGEGPFLRTGDLGFVREGQLFVTGRRKDVIIVRGKNLYPQDLERTVEALHPALRPGCGAAFSVDSGGAERVVVVHELDRRIRRDRRLDAMVAPTDRRRYTDRRTDPLLPEIVPAPTDELDSERVLGEIVQRLVEEHDVHVAAVVLIKPGTIPKTSSGKIQRSATRAEYLSDRLETIAKWTADAGRATRADEPRDREASLAEGALGALQRSAARVLGVSPQALDPERPLSRYGLDSLAAVELQHAVSLELGREVSLAKLLAGPTLLELAKLLEGTAETTEATTIRRSTDPYAAGPLSHGQRALWFVERLAPESAVNNIASALRIRSRVDAPALRRAFDRLRTRHAVLRSRFRESNDGGQQSSGDDARPFFRVVKHLGSQDELARQLGLETSQPFDLTQNPPLRVTLYELAGSDPVLLFVIHHLVTDFWSLGILVDELGALYRHELEHAPWSRTLTDETTLQYSDYVTWQDERVAGAQLDESWRYWREQLGGELPVLDLPLDRPRPRAGLHRGASRVARIRARTTTALRRFAEAEGATPFMALLGAFEVLLHRYSGQDELIIGIPSAGRTRPELANVMGYFVNSLPILLRIDETTTMREVTHRVRTAVVSALTHQALPFSQLVSRLGVERDGSRTPLFQVMFVMQQASRARTEGLGGFALGEAGARMNVGGLDLESVAIEARSAPFDLTVAVAAQGDELMVSFQYDKDLFDERTIEQMAGHYIRLVEALLEQPDAEVLSIPMLSEEEKHQQLVTWNHTTSAQTKELLIHELFGEQADQTPDALAVTFEGESLTYRELDERSNQLGHFLRKRGVGPDVLVGLCVERSLDMVVGVLGILKAGGAYVPLDPSYPEERIAYMLADSGIELLLTQERLLGTLSARDAICLDRDWAIVGQERKNRPTSSTRPMHLAYVIYTSGSTGKPKGAQLAHENVVRLFAATKETYCFGATDVWTMFHSYAFDFSVWEIWGALLHGGKLVVVPQWMTRDALAFHTLLVQERVTVLNQTPSSFYELIRADEASQRSNELSLRVVIFGGEALEVRALVPWYERHADDQPQLVNMYGITETTVHVTHRPLRKSDASGAVGSPIGRAIVGLSTHVVDSRNALVAVGVRGELCVGGYGLARGYVSRPDRTAEKFIPDPFSTPGARTYRTGDLARWLPDGSLDYLGRIDHQVKIRGFRIELGEIESALSEQPGVRDAVVLAREDAPGARRLVAYVAGVTDVTTLRSALARKLPEYMVPAAFVIFDALPLSPNGKVDRKALPAPEFRGGDAAYVAPRNEIEERLVKIWKEVLRIERVGVRDGFFELGGHSLMATQLSSHVRGAFDVELPVRAVFDAPTVEALADRVRELELAGRAGATSIERVAREGELELSYAQERLWFLDQLEPQSGAYNVPAALRLRGMLDRSALEQSVRELAARHESLRTRVVTKDGVGRQIIDEPGSLVLQLEDLSVLDDEAREKSVAAWAAAEATRPFDLAAGPLVRATLLCSKPEEHVLLFTMHHIVSDGWSMGVLVRELGALYAAHVRKEAPALASLPVQYADYAAWQRQWLRGDELSRQVDHWRRALTGAPALLSLPTDRPRPAQQSHRGTSLPIALDVELSRALVAMGQAQGVTPFMVLLAGLSVLLSRYSRQTDVVIGTAIANRTRREVEGLIGFFVNTLALRTRVRADESVETLLAEIKEQTLAAYANQDLPFEKLVEMLGPERSLGHAPIFQVMFVVQNAPMGTLDLPGVVVQPVAVEATTAKFDLTLSLSEGPSGFAGSVEYASDLFDRATVERMMAHWKKLLASMVAQPRARALELPLLSARETHQQLVEWNDTARSFPNDSLVNEMFAAQAHETPDAVAVTFQDRAWTYRELDERSNQLGHYLQKRGVRPDALIGLCVERSLEMVVGVLGILKAGGAYVPLDPRYPEERLEYMLGDSATTLLVTQDELWRGRHGLVVRLDSDWQEIEQEPKNAPTSAARPENLAYVIYTSGSTGGPKGVALSHRALVNLVSWSAREYLGGARALQFASLSFDASFLEMFSTWQVGGTLFVVPEAARTDVAALRRLIATNQIDQAQLPGLVLQALAEDARGREGELASLERLATTGEQLQIGSGIVALFERLPTCRLYNFYGPSETHGVTVYRLPAEAARFPAWVPIGRPIDNCRIYLLDDARGPVPIGVEGEVYIGGVALARGYLNRPELTADRFVPSPFERGERLYRTGDRARYLSDGTIEHLGRVDHQVKVRGFRIELGEIEAALSEQSGVREAVVVVQEDAPGQRRLVAYVTGTVDVAILGAALTEKLPAYMVPAAFVVLDAMPLSPNGKLDRKALPAPEFAGDEAEYVAPRTEVEEKLVTVWQEVLRVARVGIRDNFFELGGHSLLATQLVSRVRQSFEVELPVRALFDAPTVEGLAARLASSAGEAVSPTLMPVPRTGHEPISFAQQRLWFLDQLEPGNFAYHVSGALRMNGAISIVELQQAFNALIARHESLRTGFEVRGDQPRQVVHPAITLAIPRVELRALSPDERAREVERIWRDEREAPFDLARPPLLRLRLLELGPDESMLLVTQHHITTDGWSLGILTRELMALSVEPGHALPSLPIQYADFAVWQRERFDRGELDAQLGYWRQQLSGAPALLRLPIDHPRSAVRSHHGAGVPVTLDVELVRGLEQLARAEQASLFMVVLAGFQILLSRYSGQEDIVVGVPVSNRGRVEVEGLIGLFVNTVAIRTDLSGDPSARNLLRRVRETALSAYAHEELPFEKIVEVLRPERRIGVTPVFQVLCNRIDASNEPLQLPGVTTELVEDRAHSARFDLSLTLSEADGPLRAELVYATDLFDRPTIERMGRLLSRVLSRIVAEPDEPIGTLSLVEASARASHTPARRPAAEPPLAHELFSAQVRAGPERIALCSGEEQLTYAELDRRVERLAQRLRRAGIGPETRVALCVDRSPALVVAILGVLRAGAAYVPIDPSSPRQRIEVLLGDSGSPLVLTQEHLRSLVVGTATRIELVEDALTDGSDADEPQAWRPVHPDQLAYVIHTSGSTGTPKGVEITHRSLGRFLAFMQGVLPLAPHDRLLQAAPYHFDISLREIFGALTAGAALILAPAGEHRDIDRLVALIEAQCVTQARFVPLLLQTIVERADRQRLASLRRVFTGGEAVRTELAERWRAAFDVPLYSTYGPTETTINAAFHLCSPADSGETVPLGEPVAAAQLLVLDDQCDPVSIGLVGELCIAGELLARGYARAADQTAERFVPNPYGVAGERMYRSGDRVRRAVDGVLEFIGRRDRQVKVRGFRIELGEIEAALSRHPRVRAAVVVARAAQEGDVLLSAYVEHEGAAPTNRELRDYLRQRLPDHMVPARYAALTAFPLSRTGKLDRGALPEISVEEEAQAGSAPRTPTEELVASAFAGLLGGEVGAEARFFERGGHSLLATRLQLQLQRSFEVELPLRVIFEHDSVAEIAVEIEARRGRGLSLLEAITPVDRRRPLVLSSAQQRLWFLDRLEPGSAAYNIQRVFRVSGFIDPQQLERVLEALVARHEPLRTTFAVDSEGMPHQIVAETLPAFFEVWDLSAEDPAIVSAKIAEEISTPFDLERGPLLRVRLVRIGPEEHWLSVVMHHIVADGWSLEVLVGDLRELYVADVQGRPGALVPLPVQYADYAAWERRRAAETRAAGHLAYWRARLEDAVELLPLPTDRPRPPVLSDRGARVPVELSAELTRRIDAFCRREAVTPYMLVTATLALLLARYAGQRDVCIGSPIANRARVGTEKLIGFFVNTVVLRVDLAGDPSVRSVLARVRRAVLEAHEHEEFAFDRVVDALRPERSLSHTPLFQVMLAMYDASPTEVVLPGVVLAPLDVGTGTAKFDLNLQLKRGETLRGTFEYSTDLFDRATIERMAQRWQTLIEAMIERPSAPVFALPLFAPGERQLVVSTWNDTRRTSVDAGGVHGLFEAQAARTPDAIAFVWEGTSLSYAALEARANQVAHHLRGSGIGPESRVAISLARGLEVPVAVLAVLKAGAAYVPIDPGHPEAHRAYIVEDAQVQMIIADGPLSADVPVLRLSEAAITAQSTQRAAAKTDPDSLAYVLYTSGSTGRPKGVAMPHRPLVSLVAWSGHAYLGGMRALQFAALGFDASFLELFSTWAVGGAVFMASEETRTDVNALRAFIAHHQIDEVQLPVVVLQQLAEQAAGREDELSSLRKIATTGEQLQVSRPIVSLLLELPRCVLYNFYGPTETHGVTSHVLPADRLPTWAPIGRPIDNAQVYVLDAVLEPVPVALVGELYVGGDALARGYFLQPARTAERFVPDPFGCGGRLYRTGDLGRFLADGLLEYLGRGDRQVKLRGFRIELEEIEAVLLEEPGVIDAVVLLREDMPGDARLCAYVVLDDATEDLAALRARLHRRLPRHMLPSAIVPLAALPLTPNKKIDRRALPAPARRSADTQRTEPRNANELVLTRIWEKVLGVDGVDLRDNFFELGGHSLVALQLIGQIARETGRVVPVRALFQHPTIEQLAASMLVDEKHDSLVVPLQARGSREPLFLVHGAGGNVHRYLGLAAALDEEQPTYGLQAQGVDDDLPPLATVSEMAARYVVEMKRIQPTGPYHLGGWSMGGAVALEIALALQAAGEEVAFLALIDTTLPRSSAPLDDIVVAHSFARELLGRSETGLSLDLHGAWLETVLREAHARGTIPPSVDEVVVRRLFGVFHASTVGWWGYLPSRRFEGTLKLLFAAAGGDSVTRQTAYAGIATDVDVTTIAGGHFELLEPGSRGKVADWLTRGLAEARARRYGRARSDATERR